MPVNQNVYASMAVADPGFSLGGDTNSKRSYYLAIFPPKLHEIERIWTPGEGAHVPGAPLDPPMHGGA